MRRMIVGLILLVGAVALVFAAPASDVSVTADGTVTLTGYTTIELLTLDGDATFYFTNGGSSAGDTIKVRYGRDGFVRVVSWQTQYDGINTLLIDIDTASEVVYTLE